MPRVIEVELEADENDFTILVTRKTSNYSIDGGEIEGVCTLQGELEHGRLYEISATDAVSARTFTMPLSGKHRP